MYRLSGDIPDFRAAAKTKGLKVEPGCMEPLIATLNG
jgi:hypothetical protein